MSSSILNSFLQGDGMSGACSGSIKSWLCIAVPQRLAHFPTFIHAKEVGQQVKKARKGLYAGLSKGQNCASDWHIMI